MQFPNFVDTLRQIRMIVRMIVVKTGGLINHPQILKANTSSLGFVKSRKHFQHVNLNYDHLPLLPSIPL